MVGLYFLPDPKLVELGVLPAGSQEDIVMARYEGYTRNALLQLRRIREGSQIEQDHMRNRQMIVHWLMANTDAIEKRVRGGKTFYVMVDWRAFHAGVETLLGEVQRIKSEGDYDAALKAYARAGKLHGEAGDALGEASAMVNMGNVHFRQGELDAALEHYDQAFKIHEQADNIMGQARALTNIGSLLSRQGQLTAALETLHRARDFYLEVGDDSRGLDAVDKLIARLE